MLWLQRITRPCDMQNVKSATEVFTSAEAWLMRIECVADPCGALPKLQARRCLWCCPLCRQVVAQVLASTGTPRRLPEPFRSAAPLTQKRAQQSPGFLLECWIPQRVWIDYLLALVLWAGRFDQAMASGGGGGGHEGKTGPMCRDLGLRGAGLFNYFCLFFKHISREMGLGRRRAWEWFKKQ